jgi:transcriptional regulator with XRE-family HTH domain
MPDWIDAPFGDAVRALMRAQGLTFRGLEQLSRERDPQRRGLTSAYINQLVNSQATLSRSAIERVAQALGVHPCYFQEYRAISVQGAFDHTRVDPVELSRRLKALQGLVIGDEDIDAQPLRKLRNSLFCDDDPMPPIMNRLARAAEEADLES